MSGGDGIFSEYKVKCNDFDLLVATDIAESSLNLPLLEQFSDASSLRPFTF